MLRQTQLYYFDGSDGCPFCHSNSGTYAADKIGPYHPFCDCPIEPITPELHEKFHGQELDIDEDGNLREPIVARLSDDETSSIREDDSSIDEWLDRVRAEGLDALDEDGNLKPISHDTPADPDAAKGTTCRLERRVRNPVPTYTTTTSVLTVYDTCTKGLPPEEFEGRKDGEIGKIYRMPPVDFSHFAGGWIGESWQYWEVTYAVLIEDIWIVCEDQSGGVAELIYEAEASREEILTRALLAGVDHSGLENCFEIP